MGCYFLLQGNLPNPGIEPGFPELQADSLPTKLQGKPVAEPQMETRSPYILSLLGHQPSMVGSFVLRWPRFKFLLCHRLTVAKLG